MGGSPFCRPGSTLKSSLDLVRVKRSVLRQLRILNGVPQPPLSCLFFSFLGLAFSFFFRAARSCFLSRNTSALGQTWVLVLMYHIPLQTHILLFKRHFKPPTSSGWVQKTSCCEGQASEEDVELCFLFSFAISPDPKVQPAWLFSQP